MPPFTGIMSAKLFPIFCMSEAQRYGVEVALQEAAGKPQSPLAEMGREGMSADQVARALHPDAGKALWTGGAVLDANGNTVQQAARAAVEQHRLLLFPALADGSNTAAAPFSGPTSGHTHFGSDSLNNATAYFSGPTTSIGGVPASEISGGGVGDDCPGGIED